MSRRAAAPALALVLLTASPAAAHTGLSGSLPADGATAAAPEQVVLSFSGEVVGRLSAVTVVGDDGADAADGRPVVEGTDVVQPLERPLEPGRWTVSYRVVAVDGHPLTGQLAFTVGGAGAAAPPAAGPAQDDTAGGRAGSPAGPDAPSALLLAVATAGAVALAALVRRRRSRG